MSDLARRLASLTPEKQKQLSALLEKRGLSASDLPILPRSETRDTFPLSFAQERLWFIHQLAPESTAYNLSSLLPFKAHLDLAMLGATFDEIVRRHETLRTRFALTEDEPCQVVEPHRPRPVPGVDLRGLPEELRDRELRRWTTRAARLPFDLSRTPLWRLLVFRLAPDHHVVFLSMHHIVTDGVSLENLWREIRELYQAFATGRPSPLAELPIQYGDYALWQRRWLSGEILESQARYWQEKLAGAPAVLDLPTDRPRPPVQTYRGNRCAVVLDEELVGRLKALSRQNEATLFVTLMAALQVILGRYSGQDDLCIGTSIAGRHKVETERLIGFFVNTLVLRADLGSGRPQGPTFAEHVGATRRAVLEAHENQDLPFERLIQRLQPERNLSYSPLFQVMFAMQARRQAAARRQRDENGATPKPSVGSEAINSTFDLNLEIAEIGDEVRGALYYNVDLFDDTTVRRLLGHYEALLRAAVEAPERGVRELPIALPGERQALLLEWNDTARTFPELDRPADPAIHELFDARAQAVPDAVALVARDAALTYAELDRRSDRLAHHLRSLGIGLEAPVGICLERSVEMVVALLAVLKAGAAYVPLDPDYPADRLLFMAEDAVARAPRPVVLTQEHLLDSLPWSGDGNGGSGGAIECIALDRPTPTLAEVPAAGPVDDPGRAPAARPPREALAYMIYTSGSTGRPKGVMNAHRGVVNRLLWMQAAFGLDGTDAVLQKTPMSFDVSVWEFFWPLATGARLVMAEPKGHQDPAYLVETIERERITTMHFVPAMLEAFVEEPGLDRCRTLRRIVTSGEALPGDLAHRCIERVGAPLHNLYGPTEAAVDVTAWPASGDPKEQGVPIGRPVANTQILVMDRELRPSPRGVPGELLIGGVQVARGYLGRPALTAERFVPAPDAGDAPAVPGARLYRTGDRVRTLAGGEIEFLGRLDSQVKVRGFRVELGEVEARCATHPAIREAAVVVQGEAADARRLVAFLIPEDPDAFDLAAVREHLAETLPDHMVPSLLVPIDELPLSPSGKVDRKALARRPLPGAAGAPGADTKAGLGRAGGAGFVAPASEVERAIAGIWRELLGLETLGIRDNFFELGGHSLLLARVRRRLREELGCDVPILDLFRYPTIAALAAHLGSAAGRTAGTAGSAPFETGTGVGAGTDTEAGALPGAGTPRAAALIHRERPSRAEPIAIVGMAGRFAGAQDLDAFWRHLSDGDELIRAFTDEELQEVGFDRRVLERPEFVKACGLLEGVDTFDAGLFGISPREASLIDPQQRVFLEVAWEALERAGYDPETTADRIGVFAGIGLNRYLRHLFSNPEVIQSAGEMQIMLANDKDYVATRTSYKLNLKGPSVTVQTACSTSLVAIHMACRSLREGECEMALAGGVSLLSFDKTGYIFQEGGIMSPDGHCRAFDADARGTVGGSGVGIVVLKPLAAALADRDPIDAVIRGSAINNDGSYKVGFTAPSVEGQARALADALADAEVDPATVGYVETHGTGTSLGDPIEVAALTQAYGAGNGHRRALGSVKTNIGHTDAAAGVAGLIKATLALKHAQVPPSLHFKEPNPQIDFDAGGFYVNTELSDWEADGTPRRAGVSAFGLGGTNAHAVLEEAPPQDEEPAPGRAWQLAVLSGRTPTALERSAERLAGHLERHGDLHLPDVAYTLQVGRKGLTHRRAVVCRDLGALRTVLGGDAAPAAALVPSAPSGARERPVAFLFPGQGAQHPGMGQELYETEEVYRRTVDACCDRFAPILGFDLREILHPAGDGSSGDAFASAAERLRQTACTQPALFAVEMALARLWMSWGVRPEAMVGHSVGEYAAACVAGVFTLEEAATLVARRGQLLQGLPGGAMLSVPLPAEEIEPLLGETLSLAAVNGPQQCVVSGPETAVARFEERLEGDDVATRRLHTSHAFHSGMVEPVMDAFRREVAALELRRPRLPFLSNVTGTWIRDDEATDPDYWARHLRRPVRFADALDTLATLGQGDGAALLEVGPGRTLTTLARRHPQIPADRPAVVSLRPPQRGGKAGGSRSTRAPGVPEAGQASDLAHLLAAVGGLWTAGVRIDWHAVSAGQRRRRLALPTYPFERERHWVEPAKGPVAGRGARRGAHASGQGKLRPEDWLYAPVWKPATPPAADAAPSPDLSQTPRPAECWLLFTDGGGLADRLADHLEARGRTVRRVRPGEAFADAGDGTFRLGLGRPEDYGALLRALEKEGLEPTHIGHFATLDSAPPPRDGERDGARDGAREESPREVAQRIQEEQEHGFLSLLYLTQALAARPAGEPIRLTLVSTGLQAVDGSERLRPEGATALGLLRVCSQEHDNIVCRNVDVVVPAGERGRAELVERLAAELASPEQGVAVAYRRDGRWVQSYEPLEGPEPEAGHRVLRQQGVYLLTGGLGRIGLALAEDLARVCNARLVLTGRTPLPEREAWDGWLAEHGEDDPTSRKIARVRALEEAGAEVLVLAADVADRRQMAEAVRRAHEHFGALHGVVHLAGELKDWMLPLEETDADLCRAQFLPKVYGLYVLEEVLEGLDLDFCILFSSLAAVLGGLGLAAYASANTFIDAFARRHNREHEVPWLSIAWDAWQFDAAAQGIGRGLAQLALHPDEGVEAFHRALVFRHRSQVVVSTGDLEARLATWLRPAQEEAQEQAPAADSSRSSRWNLSTEYEEPSDETEKVLTELWQELLGIDSIGIHDNFFELGGDSLVGIQMISRVRRMFQTKLSLRDLFEGSTVAELASLVSSRQQGDEERNALEELLAEIEDEPAQESA